MTTIRPCCNQIDGSYFLADRSALNSIVIVYGEAPAEMAALEQLVEELDKMYDVVGSRIRELRDEIRVGDVRDGGGGVGRVIAIHGDLIVFESIVETDRDRVYARYRDGVRLWKLIERGNG